ncbi:hypothetical protein [Pedosphaera parvula]|uniref:Uncharacterized protein n=1 Tax=Pedosphaera parvula (strain Ellin514) TaxID=320771 RepID=B9XK29_PEDPL|nr:hypothetical protein [Pedosphaera parvula]EEF59852.1 hypothetical protein Cflav_PD2859 [Pedosphaera parvula Ellin514]
MSSDFDATDFVDNDYQSGPQTPQNAGAGAWGGANRPPTREEVDSKVGETQQKLAELKRVQEQLERERAALEETRRRQSEYQNGREEMVQNLTRGVGLLEEAEFNARRDAEQMSKTLGRPEGCVAESRVSPRRNLEQGELQCGTDPGADNH